jgi:putative SbcD/Mre11-related phosphoesterase
MIAWDDWLLTPARAAIHRPTATAVVADLHLGYAEARRRAGESIPTPSVEEVLRPLLMLLRTCNIHALVIAGDLFETGPEDGVIKELENWLEASEVRTLSIIPGNHDRGLRTMPEALRAIEEEVLLGKWRIIHGDTELPSGPVVQGHVHPGIRMGRSLVHCYLAKAGHLVLPAYSQDAAGCDIRNDPRWRGYRCLAIEANAVVETALTRQRRSK